MDTQSVTYSSFLRLPALLTAQEEPTAHDELLFVIIHQSHELWFKLLLYELDAVHSQLRDGACAEARQLLKRAVTIVRTLTTQWDVLDTMMPDAYLAFRGRLESGSGFQSVQFREIEFLCGKKEPGYLDRVPLTADERARLERRLAEPSLADALRDVMRRRNVDDVAVVLTEPARDRDLADLIESLMDFDSAFALWRSRHVLMVERQIGHKPGTGGSSGTDYLRSTLATKFFPALWEARTRL